jgi:hypothetical protein
MRSLRSCNDPRARLSTKSLARAQRLLHGAKGARLHRVQLKTVLLLRLQRRRSGDPAKDNASAGEALPIIGRAVCEDGGAPEKPDDAVEITEQTVGLSEGDPAPSQTPPEIEVQASRPNTKRAQLIGLLERPEGASVGEIGERLGWLPHTVRAALTGLRRAGREVSRDKNAEGRSIYRLAPVATSTR